MEMEPKQPLGQLAELFCMPMPSACQHLSQPLRESNIGYRLKLFSKVLSQTGVLQRAQVEMGPTIGEVKAQVGM